MVAAFGYFTGVTVFLMQKVQVGGGRLAPLHPCLLLVILIQLFFYRRLGPCDSQSDLVLSRGPSDKTRRGKGLIVDGFLDLTGMLRVMI